MVRVTAIRVLVVDDEPNLAELVSTVLLMEAGRSAPRPAATKRSGPHASSGRTWSCSI
jgi:hypothetical protein